jgi:hypothetical protein
VGEVADVPGQNGRSLVVSGGRDQRRGFAGRIRHILAAQRSDVPVTLEQWDPPAVAVSRRDHLRSGAELAAEFDDLRADSLGVVRGLDPGDLTSVGIHPAIGALRVDEVLAEWVHHDRQMLAVTQARIWGQIGNARRFSLEDL